MIGKDGDAILETVARWGNRSSALQQLSTADLDLAHLEKSRAVNHPDVGQVYSRIAYSQSKRLVQVPVSSSEKLLAALIFSFDPGESRETEDGWQKGVESKQMLITEVVEHYALALVNLRLREMLRMESIHDPLTGLYNRRHMEAALEREAHRAQRYDTSVGVVLFDIDHFKAFNDTHGHKAGDAVLREIGALLNRSSRGEDICCRYGGEEFLQILPDATLEDTRKRAEQLLERVRQHNVLFQEQTLSVTVSIGIAAFPLHGPGIQDSVTAADGALYQAKKGGRDQIEVAGARP